MLSGESEAVVVAQDLASPNQCGNFRDLFSRFAKANSNSIKQSLGLTSAQGCSLCLTQCLHVYYRLYGPQDKRNANYLYPSAHSQHKNTSFPRHILLHHLRPQVLTQEPSLHHAKNVASSGIVSSQLVLVDVAPLSAHLQTFPSSNCPTNVSRKHERCLRRIARGSLSRLSSSGAG